MAKSGLDQRQERYQTKVFECKEARIEYAHYAASHPSNKWILLFPGLGGSIDSAKYLYPLVCKTHHILCFNLPFQGKSLVFDVTGNNGHMYSIAIQKVIKSDLAPLQVDQLTLIGHSLGGIYALDFAINYAKSLSKLLLVAPAGFSPRDQFFFGLCSKKWFKGIISNSYIVRYLSNKIWQTDDPVRRLAFEQQVKRTFTHPEGFDLSLRKRLHLLLQIECETTILWAKDDPLNSYIYANEAKNHFVYANLSLLQNGGHNLLKTRADKIAEAL